jgi:hypothetical protein
VDAAQRVKQMWGGKVEALLARRWPESTGLMPGSSPTLCKALLHWGSPAALANDADAPAELRGFGGHYLTDARIAAVIGGEQVTLSLRYDTVAAFRLTPFPVLVPYCPSRKRGSRSQLVIFIRGPQFGPVQHRKV